VAVLVDLSSQEAQDRKADEGKTEEQVAAADAGAAVAAG
jgi:hypothetical protein